jgi:hypothetical protein
MISRDRLIFLLFPVVCLVLGAHPAAAEHVSNALTSGKRLAETTIFPTGDLFKPLLADLKEPRFYLAYRRYDYVSERVNAGVGGYGEIFGLYRKVDGEKGTAWQASFGGGIHSQFNLDARSFALVNTDFTIGFPFTYRTGMDSLRVTVYHQSSHLGDEFLLQTKTDRMELSYEAINIIASREWMEWRLYGGGEYMFHRVPDLRPFGFQAGIEFYGIDAVTGRGRPVAGLDVKVDQEHDWALNVSLKAGLQFDSTEATGRFIRLLAEAYKGYAPHGQFYTNRVDFFGIGIALGFD